jgi:hypothetical protein
MATSGSTHARIDTWLRELFGALVEDPAPDGAIRVRVGSAVTETRLVPWGDGDFVVSTRARVAAGADLAPELLRYLLRRNDDVRFGAFGLDADGVIFYRHDIVAGTCDREELRASVTSVALVADRYDDEIVTRWGGRRAMDAPGAGRLAAGAADA